MNKKLVIALNVVLVASVGATTALAIVLSGNNSDFKETASPEISVEENEVSAENTENQEEPSEEAAKCALEYNYLKGTQYKAWFTSDLHFSHPSTLYFHPKRREVAGITLEELQEDKVKAIEKFDSKLYMGKIYIISSYIKFRFNIHICRKNYRFCRIFHQYSTIF